MEILSLWHKKEFISSFRVGEMNEKLVPQVGLFQPPNQTKHALLTYSSHYLFVPDFYKTEPTSSITN